MLQSLRERGIGSPALIISDAHPGLGAARTAVFSGVPGRRCQFHLRQNAQAYIFKADQKPVVAGEIRRIFDSARLAEAEEPLRQFITTYRGSAPKLAVWLEENLPDGADEAHEGGFVGEQTIHGGAAADLAVEVFISIGGAQATALCLALAKDREALGEEISENWETSKCHLSLPKTTHSR